MRLFVTQIALFAAIVLLGGGANAVASQLTISNQSGAAGASVLVPVAFLSQQSLVSGIQFDVQYDNTVLNVGVILGDAAANAGKGFYALNVADNTKRILISGLNQNVIADGTLVSLSINISPGASGGSYQLSLLNAAATNASAQPIAVTTASAALAVTGIGQGIQFQVSGVRSAASWLAGSVSPGEIVTLLGSQIGPVSPQFPSAGASSTTLSGTSVSFDGTLAPLLYAGPDQINAVVPYGVAGQAATKLQILAQGQPLGTLSVPVTPAAPAIFSLDSTGVGPGAILNQDMTVNSFSNPAAKGSVISIYATGAGQTGPTGVDGQVTGSTLSHPLLAVSVQIGGLTSNVLYAGSAPGLISGLIQVNALVPDGVVSGPSVPVLLTVGTAASQSGIIIAVQ
jgi:uncharacterized protein (TIGR03437 family)